MNGESSELTAWVALMVIGLGVILFLVVSIRFTKKRQKGQETLQSLGFKPIPRDTTLEMRLRNLYGNPYAFFRELYQRRMPDSVLYVFGLDTPDGVLISRGIAIMSSNLSLSSFKIFPKIDSKQFGLGKLANQMIEQAVSRVDEKVEFPEFPEFNKKYLLFSSDQKGVRKFFTDRMADYFSGTNLVGIMTEGDLLVFEDYSTPFAQDALSALNQNVRQAIEIYHLFQSH